MKTVKSNLKVSGAGLMFALPVDLEIKPADKKGIRFHIGENVVEAKLENVVSTEHCVIVADVEHGAKHKVALIEHFMAACAICDVEALDVYFSSQQADVTTLELVEMPIFDGSAKVWVEKFNEAGYVGDSIPQKMLSDVVIFQRDKSAIFMVPSEHPTTITYAVNYNHPDLKNRWATLDIEKNLGEIIEARTFGYLSDLEKFQAAGYSKGVTIDNTVGLKDDGTYTVPLRSEFECAKHKILDIIGDLYLTGYNPFKLNANILVKEAGHGYHMNAAKGLKKVLSGQGEQ